MNAGANIPFAASFFPPVGSISYDGINNDFDIGKAGYYLVSFGVTQRANNVTIALFVNGTLVAGTNVLVNGTHNFLSATFIIPLNVGDTLSLVNTSLGAITLETEPAAGSPTLAYITIQRLNNL